MVPLHCHSTPTRFGPLCLSFARPSLQPLQPSPGACKAWAKTSVHAALGSASPHEMCLPPPLPSLTDLFTETQLSKGNLNRTKLTLFPASPVFLTPGHEDITQLPLAPVTPASPFRTSTAHPISMRGKGTFVPLPPSGTKEHGFRRPGITHCQQHTNP